MALSYGADDLHGTIIEEPIFHIAGATAPQWQTERGFVSGGGYGYAAIRG